MHRHFPNPHHSPCRPRMLAALAVLLLGACSGSGRPHTTATTSALASRIFAGSLLTAADSKYGPIVTTYTSITLYANANDTGTNVTCDGACTKTWEPLELRPGQVASDPRLDARLVGEVARRGGVNQVTYGGHPLYVYTGDHAGFQTNGEGAQGVWFVVSTTGQLVRGGS